MKPSNRLANTALVLTGITGLALAFTLSKKAGAVKNMKFFPANVDNVEIRGIKIVLDIGLRVQNTSNEQVTLYSFAGDIYMMQGGSKVMVGNVNKFDEPVSIKPNSSTVILMDAEIYILSAGNAILTAFLTGNYKQKFSMQGHANVSKYQLPVNIDYSVG